jgi:hypothetical protein
MIAIPRGQGLVIKDNEEPIPDRDLEADIEFFTIDDGKGKFGVLTSENLS